MRLAHIVNKAMNTQKFIKKIKPEAFKRNYSRIKEDIMDWSFKMLNGNKPGVNNRAKSVISFDKQVGRKPFSGDIDCHEKRFEYVDSRINHWSKYHRSSSPNFKKMTNRTHKKVKHVNMHTYDANPEYCKSSLANGIPSFERYISRPPNN